MSNELIRKIDVLDLLNDFYSDFEEYSHLFDDIDFMNPVNAVELPCKIGDKIYEPWRCGRIHVQTVKGFTVSDHVEMVNCETKNYSVREIGNTAFFTREEAERALEELRNE